MSPETRTPRRVSKLSLTPLMLSGCAWVCIALACASFLIATPTTGGYDGWPIFYWVTAASISVGLGLSLASLATGGLSLIRIQLGQRDIRGRGIAAIGCLSALPALLVSSIPFVSLLAFIVFAGCLIWSMSGSTPDFIW